MAIGPNFRSTCVDSAFVVLLNGMSASMREFGSKLGISYIRWSLAFANAHWRSVELGVKFSA